MQPPILIPIIKSPSTCIKQPPTWAIQNQYIYRTCVSKAKVNFTLCGSYILKQALSHSPAHAVTYYHTIPWVQYWCDMLVESSLYFPVPWCLHLLQASLETTCNPGISEVRIKLFLRHCSLSLVHTGDIRTLQHKHKDQYVLMSPVGTTQHNNIMT